VGPGPPEIPPSQRPGPIISPLGNPHWGCSGHPGKKPVARPPAPTFQSATSLCVARGLAWSGAKGLQFPATLRPAHGRQPSAAAVEASSWPSCPADQCRAPSRESFKRPQPAGCSGSSSGFRLGGSRMEKLSLVQPGALPPQRQRPARQGWPSSEMANSSRCGALPARPTRPPRSGPPAPAAKNVPASDPARRCPVPPHRGF